MTLSFDPASIAFAPAHYIGGEVIADCGGIDLCRPSDGQPIAACPVADAALVDRAVETARAAWQDSRWGQVQPRERVRVLQAWADLVEAQKVELAQVEAVPSTRLVAEVVAGDVPVVAEQIRFFAELADKTGGDLAPTAETQLGFVEHEPYGVIGAITPWNYPLSMAVWKLGPALAAGNAVVLKPSELTPTSVVRLVQLAERAGLPKGLVNIVQGDGAVTGTALTGHPGIGKVSFTGSTRAGAAIMENVARTGIKPVTLELGGKSPQVVFADADLERTIDCVARGILPNAGQFCVAGSRLIVEEPMVEALLDGVRARMQAVRPGPTWDAETTFSPVISDAQCARMERIVTRSVEQGADVLIGGARMERAGFFFEPTILTNVRADMQAVRDEIFGPVLTVQTFASEEEALALADHPTYGLCAGLHTRDLSRAMRLSRAMQAGTVWVNRYGRSRDHFLPTGGYKASGLGKDLGREAYLGAMRSKSVLIDL